VNVDEQSVADHQIDDDRDACGLFAATPEQCANSS
jgi:hypothetical protein